MDGFNRRARLFDCSSFVFVVPCSPSLSIFIVDSSHLYLPCLELSLATLLCSPFMSCVSDILTSGDACSSFLLCSDRSTSIFFSIISPLKDLLNVITAANVLYCHDGTKNHVTVRKVDIVSFKLRPVASVALGHGSTGSSVRHIYSSVLPLKLRIRSSSYFPFRYDGTNSEDMLHRSTAPIIPELYLKEIQTAAYSVRVLESSFLGLGGQPGIPERNSRSRPMSSCASSAS